MMMNHLLISYYTVMSLLLNSTVFEYWDALSQRKQEWVFWGSQATGFKSPLCHFPAG